jgi:hypothetical protein
MRPQLAGVLGFIAAAAFLLFLSGAFVMLSGIFPAETLRNAYRGGEALLARETEYRDPLKTDLWAKARRSERGVTICEEGAMAAGYTLYTSGDGPRARLIAPDGTVVHEWTKPFSEIWNDSAAVKNPRPDNFIYFNQARVLPNGDLLAIFAAVGDTPWGYGMVRLSRDSQVIWSYLDHTHHDFDVAADGRIFALTHHFTSEKLPDYEKLERPRLDDFVVVLSPEGKEIKRVSVIQALIKSRYRGMLYSIPYFALGDPLHTNAIEVIRPDNAARFPQVKPGQVLLSFREPGMIAVLDLDSETIVWATRGSWVGQHDPSLLPNGNILLFDNLGGFEEQNMSRILEFDPETMDIVWRYVGTADQPFDSSIRSTVERLQNGDTLITESNGGRLFEVASDGRIVWEYLDPIRAGDGDEFIPIMSSGQRIDPASLDADFRDSLGPAAPGCGSRQTAAMG